MKKVFGNYKSTIILVLAIILGGIVGAIFGEKTKVLAPFGDVFLNLLLVIIIPLIFLTLSTSVAKMKEKKRLGKIMRTIVLIFVLTSVVAAIFGIISTSTVSLVDQSSKAEIESALSIEEAQDEDISVNVLEKTAQLITVDDFNKLLSKENIIALVCFSILFGLAIRRSGEKGEKALEVLCSFNEVVLKFVELIMLYAPIGIGCYFAVLVGTLGASIAASYFKTFIVYLLVAIVFYFIIYTFYAYLAAGKKGAKAFWKNILPTTLTSLATCSSAACIPVNVQVAKNIGVSDDIAETLIPMGTSFHKDGSIIGSVFKIMFLVYLFEGGIGGTDMILKVIGIALLATLLVTAVPIGGGTISESLIISLLGYSMSCLPILTIIATIIDAPATVLNVVGDTSSSMLVSRIVDGKDWMEKNESKAE